MTGTTRRQPSRDHDDVGRARGDDHDDVERARGVDHDDVERARGCRPRRRRACPRRRPPRPRAPPETTEPPAPDADPIEPSAVSAPLNRYDQADVDMPFEDGDVEAHWYTWGTDYVVVFAGWDATQGDPQCPGNSLSTEAGFGFVSNSPTTEGSCDPEDIYPNVIATSTTRRGQGSVTASWSTTRSSRSSTTRAIRGPAPSTGPSSGLSTASSWVRPAWSRRTSPRRSTSTRTPRRTRFPTDGSPAEPTEVVC